MWAARPHLASIFEKLLDQKTFYLPAARILQPIFFQLHFQQEYDTIEPTNQKDKDLQIKVKPQFSEFTNNSQDKKWHDKKAASNLKKEAA